MTITPTREASPSAEPERPEVLIREARRRGRQHRLAGGLLVFGVIAAVVAAVLVFSPSRSHTRPPRHSKATVRPPVIVTNAPQCSPSGLIAAYEGDLAGAGSWNALFTVRNASSSACSIAGFPSVRLLTSTGGASPIPISYTKGGCTRERLRGGQFDESCHIGGLKYHGAFPRAILAAHVGVASFFIEGSDNSTWGPHQAHPTVCRVAPNVQIALPERAKWLNVRGLGPYHNGIIDACGAVGVLPFVPGRSGYYPSVPLWTVLGVSGPLPPTSTTGVGSQPSLTTTTAIP